jgi:hypothetical protein
VPKVTTSQWVCSGWFRARVFSFKDSGLSQNLDGRAVRRKTIVQVGLCLESDLLQWAGWSGSDQNGRSGLKRGGHQFINGSNLQII